MYYHPVNLRDYGDVYGCDVYSTQMKNEVRYLLQGFRMPFYRSQLLRAIGLLESAMTPD